MVRARRIFRYLQIGTVIGVRRRRAPRCQKGPAKEAETRTMETCVFCNAARTVDAVSAFALHSTQQLSTSATRFTVYSHSEWIHAPASRSEWIHAWIHSAGHGSMLLRDIVTMVQGRLGCGGGVRSMFCSVHPMRLSVVSNLLLLFCWSCFQKNNFLVALISI